MAQDTKSNKSKGLAIAGMVCGICGLIFCWTLWFLWFALILDIFAIVFGSVALVKVKKGEADGKGMAIAGVVTGAVSAVISIIIAIVLAAIAGAATKAIYDYSDTLKDYNKDLDSWSSQLESYDWED